LLASTKTGTIVKLVSRREGTAAEVQAALKTLQGDSLGGLVSVVLSHEATKLLPQECRDRTVATCCQNPGLSNHVLVKRQRDVPVHVPLPCYTFVLVLHLIRVTLDGPAARVKA
jgi:hypothetical protein